MNYLNNEEFNDTLFTLSKDKGPTTTPLCLHIQYLAMSSYNQWKIATIKQHLKIGPQEISPYNLLCLMTDLIKCIYAQFSKHLHVKCIEVTPDYNWTCGSRVHL